MRQASWVRSGGLVALVLGLAGASGAGSASGQFPVASGPPIVLGSPIATTATAPVVGSATTVRPVELGPVPGSGGLGATYATPPFSAARRRARVANKYTVARPVYAGRPGVSFAPYSDYYFPRVIGSKETVYTAPAGGSVPVGEAAFRTPSPTGVPVFPREPRLKRQ